MPAIRVPSSCSPRRYLLRRRRIPSTGATHSMLAPGAAAAPDTAAPPWGHDVPTRKASEKRRTVVCRFGNDCGTRRGSDRVRCRPKGYRAAAAPPRGSRFGRLARLQPHRCARESAPDDLWLAADEGVVEREPLEPIVLRVQDDPVPGRGTRPRRGRPLRSAQRRSPRAAERAPSPPAARAAPRRRLLARQPRAGRRRPCPVALVVAAAGREPVQDEELAPTPAEPPDHDAHGERRLARHGQAVPGRLHEGSVEARSPPCRPRRTRRVVHA